MGDHSFCLLFFCPVTRRHIHFVPFHFVPESIRPIHYVPLQSVPSSSLYDRGVRDLPRSNNSVERWHRAFNCRVSIKNPTITKLAKCILREQTKFEMDIEKIRVGQERKPKKKIYGTLDS